MDSRGRLVVFMMIFMVLVAVPDALAQSLEFDVQRGLQYGQHDGVQYRRPLCAEGPRTVSGACRCARRWLAGRQHRFLPALGTLSRAARICTVCHRLSPREGRHEDIPGGRARCACQRPISSPPWTSDQSRSRPDWANG